VPDFSAGFAFGQKNRANRGTGTKPVAGAYLPRPRTTKPANGATTAVRSTAPSGMPRHILIGCCACATSGASYRAGRSTPILPSPKNYVDIDPEKKDIFGIPQLRFHFQWGPKTDPAKLLRRISDARNSVLDRIQETLWKPAHYNERQELSDALNGLRTVQQEYERRIQQFGEPRTSLRKSA
jgi:hypothetical protein